MSESNPIWVLPSDSHGLSFASTFQQTEFTLSLIGKFQKPGAKINVAYWVLEDSFPMPKELGFEQDPNNDEHYILVVKEKILITQLIEKLKLISYHMTVLTGLELEAYKK